MALSRQTWLTCLCLLPAGACWVLALSLFNVTVQLSTPRWVVGRTLSIYQTATFGGMAVGSWLWGIAAEAYGPTAALLGSGAALTVGAAIGLHFALPAFGALNLDPLNQFKEPSLRLDLKSRSGPIMIMIDYEISQEDVPAFLAVMSERRRIRIRDGARHWTSCAISKIPRSGPRPTMCRPGWSISATTCGVPKLMRRTRKSYWRCIGVRAAPGCIA